MSAQQMLEYTADVINRIHNSYPKGKAPHERMFKVVCPKYKGCGKQCYRDVCKQCPAIHDLATLMTCEQFCQCDGKQCPRVHASDLDDPSRWLRSNAVRPYEVRNLIEEQKHEIYDQLNALREETKRWIDFKRTEASRKADVMAKLEKQMTRGTPQLACALIQAESDIVSAWTSTEVNYISLMAVSTIKRDVAPSAILNLKPKSSQVIYLEGTTKGISHMLAFLNKHGICAPHQRFEFIVPTPDMQTTVFNLIPWEFYGINPVVHYVPELRIRS